jgi:hypothetical protein
MPRYLVLGDDLVIFSKEARSVYYQMVTDIGVGISLAKSVKSEPLEELVCEFAAKLVKGDRKVGPLPLGSLFRGTTLDLFTLWRAIRERALELIPGVETDRPDLIHGPDLGTAFPLRKEGVYAELTTLWGYLEIRKDLQMTTQELVLRRLDIGNETPNRLPSEYSALSILWHSIPLDMMQRIDKIKSNLDAYQCRKAVSAILKYA